MTFVLTSGGHNAGIVSEPGHPGRSYRVKTKSSTIYTPTPQAWAAEATHKEGSWWPEWIAWLVHRSGQASIPHKERFAGCRICAAVRGARNLCVRGVASCPILSV